MGPSDGQAKALCQEGGCRLGHVWYWSPLGHEAGGVLQESAAGRMGGPKTSVNSSLKGAWLNPVATAECRCHQNGHLAHSGRLQENTRPRA